MSIKVEIIDGVQVVAIGDQDGWDASFNAEVSKLVNSAIDQGLGIVLDMDGVRSLNSCVFGSIVMWRSRAIAKGRNLVLCRLSEQTKKALGTMRLNLILEVFPNQSAAVQRVKEGGKLDPGRKTRY